MSKLRWKLNQTQFYIDGFVSIIFCLLVNAGACYLFFVMITENKNIFKSDQILGVVIFSIIILEVFAWCFLLSYRVVQISERITLARPLGRKVALDISEIKSIQSWLKFMHYIKTDTGKKYILWNHMGGADELGKRCK